MGGAIVIEQLGLGLREWTSEGQFAVRVRDGLLCCNGWSSLCLATQLGIGRVDFRGEAFCANMGWACCVVTGGAAFLQLSLGLGEWNSEGRLDV